MDRFGCAAGSLDRRRFLGSTILGAVGATSLARGEGSPPIPSPCPSEAWRKLGVVFGGENSAAGRWVQNFTCLAEPKEGGNWRLWYSIAGIDVPYSVAFAEGKPGGPTSLHVAETSPGDPADAPFSIGNLPDGWRPVQPVHVGLPGGRHRLYFWAHGKKDRVARYLAAESDDGRRYRVLDPQRPCLYHHSDRAVSGAVAAEAGVLSAANRAPRSIPGEAAAPVPLITNDVVNLYRLPEGGYELYSVGLISVPKGDPRYIAHDNAPGLIRVIDRRTSDDGLSWSSPTRILEPDDRDPSDMQFYYLSVTHTDRGRVGLLGHYRVEAQTMDLEWCFSRDGIAWERPTRQAWLRRGAPGEPDSYGIYAPNSLVHRDGKWWLFYTGVNHAHNHKQTHGEPASVVMAACCDSIWA